MVAKTVSWSVGKMVEMKVDWSVFPLVVLMAEQKAVQTVECWAD